MSSLAAAPARVGAARPDRVRVAVVGLGAIAQSVHLPLLRRRGREAELVAVVDLSPARGAQIAAEGGIAAFTSVADLIAAHASGACPLDGVILATTGSHAADATRLVQAGIAVLAEKPLGYGRGDLAPLAAVPEAADRLRVGYMKEYDPAVARARELLADVKLRHVTVEVLHPADGAQIDFARLPPPPTDVDPERLARVRAEFAEVIERATAGTPPDLHPIFAYVLSGSIVHVVGLLRSLVGGVATVDRARHWAAVGATQTQPAAPGSLELGGRLARGDVPWSLGWHFISEYPEYRETVTFHHDRGTIELTFAVPYLLNAPTRLRVLERTGALGVVESVTTFPQEEAFERELAAFFELCRGNPLPGPSVAAAHDDARVTQLMLGALAAEHGSTPAPGSECHRETAPI